MIDFKNMMDPKAIMDPKNMMMPKAIIKQMVAFNKTVFENSFKGLEMMQEQAEKMTKAMSGQATWLPDGGEKAFGGFADIYKNNLSTFKTTIDGYFEKAEEYLSDKSE